MKNNVWYVSKYANISVFGENELVGAETDKIIAAVKRNVGCKVKDTQQLYLSGRAAWRAAIKLIGNGVV
jgi:hypothetical protein